MTAGRTRSSRCSQMTSATPSFGQRLRTLRTTARYRTPFWSSLAKHTTSAKSIPRRPKRQKNIGPGDCTRPVPGIDLPCPSVKQSRVPVKANAQESRAMPRSILRSRGDAKRRCRKPRTSLRRCAQKGLANAGITRAPDHPTTVLRHAKTAVRKTARGTTPPAQPTGCFGTGAPTPAA